VRRRITLMRAVISAKVSVPFMAPQAKASPQSKSVQSGAERSTQLSRYGLTLASVPRRYL
jgi:hypothetical protein